MDEVDLWMIYDNSRTPRTFVAVGGKDYEIMVNTYETFNKIKAYVS